MFSINARCVTHTGAERTNLSKTSLKTILAVLHEALHNSNEDKV